MIKQHSGLKTLADLLTGGRLAVAGVVLGGAFLGNARAYLPWIVPLVLLAWTGDLFDGWLARHSGRAATSWLGNHDLAVDASLATASLIYLARIGWLASLVLVVYLGTALLLSLLLRSHWVWNGFNTGSHLLVLGSILRILPGLLYVMLAWLAIATLVGHRRLATLARELRATLAGRVKPGT
ncbi:MAG: hypothetical protein M5U01_25365 [Ardenticatenaceae bacterium]|nr:hypothetical protein [Ardenticatenaceae bacterium]HBY95662.1 hypothetical protein [Chloroflexota bacterium]